MPSSSIPNPPMSTTSRSDLSISTSSSIDSTPQMNTCISPFMPRFSASRNLPHNELDTDPQNFTDQSRRARDQGARQTYHGVQKSSKEKTAEIVARDPEFDPDLGDRDGQILRFASIRRFPVATKSLLEIWDAVDKLSSNDDCLRIANQCAEILDFSRRQSDRKIPVPSDSLEETFYNISQILTKRFVSFHTPPTADETQNDISHCDALLASIMSTLGMRPVEPPKRASWERSRTGWSPRTLSQARADHSFILLQDGSILTRNIDVETEATETTSRQCSVPPPKQTTVRRRPLGRTSTSETRNAKSLLAILLEAIHQVGGDDAGHPSAEKAIAIQNETTYRKQVSDQHEFHELLTLPLWDPSPVEVGAVGFLSEPAGQFCTLFNSMSPTKCDKIDIKAIPPLGKDGDVTIGVDRSDTRILTHKVYDFVSGSRTVRRVLSTLSMSALPKRHTFRLKAGKAAAYMYAEVTEHHYFEDLNPPRRWFQDNVDKILAVYDSHPEVKKGTLMLVTGALRTPRYGLFVSHSHPEGRVKFKVYPNPGHREPWGVFTTARGRGKSGPTYPASGPAEDIPFDCHSKVWCVGDQPWNAILLARLQFKSDAAEPTPF